MKYTPFLIVYATGVAIASVPASSLAYADSVTRFNAAIAEVNSDPETYGLDAGVVLPVLPTVPTSKNGIYYEPNTGNTFELVDARRSEGWSAPNTNGDAILTADNLAAIVAARIALDTAAYSGGSYFSPGPI